MTTGGISNTGFIQPTTAEIQASILQSLQTLFPTLDTSTDQPIGQIAGVFAAALADAWEALGTAYGSLDPAKAEGYLLAALANLTGTQPQAATYSYATCTVNLNAGVTLSPGVVAAVTGQPNNTWVLVSPVSNVGGSAANFSATFQSSQTGPFVANPNTLTTIVTAVAGWNSVTNPTAATPGVNADTDAVLRQKRANELQGSGGSDTAAIQAALLKVTGVQQAYVYENTGSQPDASGLPGKSFRAVIYDGPSPAAANNLVAQAIWNQKPSGIQSWGSQSGNATDSRDNTQRVLFDRVANVPVYISLTTTPPNISATQAANIRTQIAAYAAANWNIGQPVLALALRAQALGNGVTDVPTFAVDTVNPPVNTGNLMIAQLQIPVITTTQILVNGS